MTNNANDALSSFRARLDVLDAKIAGLVAERLTICAEVARVKKANGIAMMQPARVESVCDAYADRAVASGVHPAFMRSLARLIVAEACRLEDEIIES
jgi:chorismate mutase